MSKAKTPEEKEAAKQKAAEKRAVKLASQQSEDKKDENTPKADNSDQAKPEGLESPNLVSPEMKDEQTPPGDDNKELPDEKELPGDSSNPSDVDSKTPEKKLAVIIPYLSAAAQGNELLYALRSIDKHFKEECQVVIIGDKEDWFSDQILHIDHVCIGENPQADVIDKMREILIDERISEEFVWTNDDIYFVSSTSMDDLRVLKTDGILKTDGSSGTYNKNRERTIAALQSHGRPIRNFATHMPVVFEKGKMMEVFEQFQKELEEGVLLSSLYFNLHNDITQETQECDWKSDVWSLRVISGLQTKEKKDLFRKLIGQKHFLNHSESGYSTLLMDWVNRQFPEKCRFEK